MSEEKPRPPLYHFGAFTPPQVPLPPPQHALPDNVSYRALVRTFDLLEEGGSLAEGILFEGKRLVNDPVLARLISANVIAKFGTVYNLSDRAALQKLWKDEFAFCALVPWNTSHAASMNVLLAADRHTRIEQANALVRVRDLLHKKVIAERLRVPKSFIDSLSAFASLPKSVQTAFDDLGIPTWQATKIRAFPSEQTMLDWVEQNFGEAADNEIIEQEQAPLDDEGVAATTLKLTAAIYEKIERIEITVMALAKGLGCEVQK